jgi:release factor glutamine methyltransferase
MVSRNIPFATVWDALDYGRDRGIEQATRAALIAHVIGMDRAKQLAYSDTPLTEAQAVQIKSFYDRVLDGEPLAYLVGEREFTGLMFHVTPAVLVPRQETELLVDAALTWVKINRKIAPRIVDVGTGSGAIAISLAYNLLTATVLATEVSEAALEIAQKNASRHHLDKRIEFIHTDLLEGVVGPFDLIAANLPYISSDILDGLTVVQHEPIVAFNGRTPDGLGLIHRLLEQSVPLLKPGGALALEIGYDQGQKMETLCSQFFPGSAVVIHKDYEGHDRVVMVETL